MYLPFRHVSKEINLILIPILMCLEPGPGPGPGLLNILNPLYFCLQTNDAKIVCWMLKQEPKLESLRAEQQAEKKIVRT